jgi:hypothetical protein
VNISTKPESHSRMHQ